MGGCRCSYRTCKATTDQQTHFFHYPVFDKVRCHEWLTNGQRLDLVDLTLSQLKNRAVCQHHFRDEMFMNSKKDKLIRSAVPTENGPYISQENIKPVPIKEYNLLIEEPLEPVEITDDKDTKYFTAREKISTYPIQYKRFLKNSDLNSLNDPDLLKSLPPSKRKKFYDNIRKPILKSSNRSNKATGFIARSLNKLYEQKNDKNVIILSEEKVSAPIPIKKTSDFQTVTPDFVIKPTKILPNGENVTLHQSQQEIEYIVSDIMPEVQNRSENPHTQVSLSQQTFKVPFEKEMDNFQNIYHVTECEPQTITIELEPIDEERMPGLKKSVKNTLTDSPPQVQDKIVHPASPKLSKQSRESLLAKSKMSPVEIAEIEKKREFNMKLKDIIQESLNRLDVSNSVKKSQKSVMSLPKSAMSLPKSVTSSPKSVKSSRNSVVSKNSTSAPSVEQQTTAETLSLMSKVDQNSREIAEIKNILLRQTSNIKYAEIKPKKVNRTCQTEWNKLSNKKYLFDKVSQYLSPSVINLVYEEMFLNKSNPGGNGRPKRQNIKNKYN